MLIFIPAYDDATKTNLNVVLPIIPHHAFSLIGEAATREQLWLQLAEHTHLFAMCHGNSDVLWDNINKPAIKTRDFQDFVEKQAFVFACYTSNELGKQLKTNRSIYWGYTGSIVTPTDEIEVIHLFREIFQFIINDFHTCKNVEQVATMIHDLKTLCHTAEETLDTLFYTGSNILSSYTCLNHIWNRLRVHHFASEEPLKHIEAREGDLFEV